MSADTIYDSLVTRAMTNPDRVALFAPGRAPLSHGALCLQLERTLGVLKSAGIGRSDRIGLALSNGPEMLTAFLGTVCGAQAAPLNPALTKDEVASALQELRIGAVVVPAGRGSPAEQAAEQLAIRVLRLSFAAEDPAGIFDLEGRDLNRLPAENPAWCSFDGTAMVLRTSGTTSRPKIVPSTHSALIAGATLTIEALGLTAADRYLCVMPMSHAHALITSLAALLAGGAVVAAPPFDADAFFHWLGEFRPTWYSAAPAIHQAVLSQAGKHSAAVDESALRFIRSSAASLPPAVLAELERVFRAPVIEGYGMTETCLYATSNPLPPRERKVGSVGIAAGVEIAIFDPTGARLPALHSGEVGLRGPNIFQGYENEPAPGAFMDGWFRTGDQGYLDYDGYLYLTGRLKETINRGGEKVSPAEVEEALGNHPDVAAAAVFAMPHPTLGEDIAAAVVLRQDGGSSVADLRRYLGRRLATYKIPGQIVLVDKIPMNPSGKIPRARLAQLLAGRLRAELVEPRNLNELRLAEIWQDVLGLPSISINDNFFALGGDSIKATQIASRMRQRFGAEIPIQIFFVAPTIAALAQELDAGAARHERTGAEADRVGAGRRREAPSNVANTDRRAEPAPAVPSRAMEFSLFFFSADGSAAHDDKYRLFLESLEFADRNGFAAVWTPERHFHPFGGLYPNPSILGAAAAALTSRIGIRAGSVVVPLQDPLRVAEEWSVIDNLSGGRVGIACASGWHANDFVLAPENYQCRRERMIEAIDVIQKLWRGDPIILPNGAGKPTKVRIYPRPIQPRLPIWLAAHSDATFIRAGEVDAHVLTALWDSDVEDLARRIRLYRKARAQRGDDPLRGKVTLMLHTYVAGTMEMVRRHVTPAYEDYLLINLGLQHDQLRSVDEAVERRERDNRFVVERATEELFRSRGLVGTPAFCREKVAALRAIGVDEIACLIDFGISVDAVLESLEQLRELQSACSAASA